MKTGIELIAEERKRQVEKEGWTQWHDALHTENEIAIAASIYAMPERLRRMRRVPNALTQRGFINLPVNWPWHADWWKPTQHDRIRELVKAGALIAAEIDRLNAVSPT